MLQLLYDASGTELHESEVAMVKFGSGGSDSGGNSKIFIVVMMC